MSRNFTKTRMVLLISFIDEHLTLKVELFFFRLAAYAIESLCNELMKDTWTSNPEWLLAVPLLHFLRGDSKPFEEPNTEGGPESSIWWGAQKLNITEFQRSDKQ